MITISMFWIGILSAVTVSWAMLRVFGGERQRQIQDLEASVLDTARKNQPRASASADA
jgi:hypothetical protein